MILKYSSYILRILKEKWTHKPFSADLIDGKIYARGTQDMKSVGIQYLEAIRYLKEDGVRLKRTIHITFVPGTKYNSNISYRNFILCLLFR